MSEGKKLILENGSVDLTVDGLLDEDGELGFSIYDSFPYTNDGYIGLDMESVKKLYEHLGNVIKNYEGVNNETT